MKLPKTVFVKVEKEANGPDYLTAAPSTDEIAGEIGESLEVGEYQLVRKVRVTTKVDVGIA